MPVSLVISMKDCSASLLWSIASVVLSISSLANSKVWMLIHPSLEEKVTLNILRSALMVSNQVEEIYIIDKDINIRETYKNIFQDIKNDIKISTQINATEDFFNSIG